MVRNMEEKKINSLNLLTVFFLSHSFYTLQILSQQLFHFYSKEAVFIICIFYLLFPIITFSICKLINNHKISNYTKNNILISILSSLYLLITSIVVLTNISNIILIYYYQQTSIIILLVFLFLPIIYILIKGDTNFFALASILLIIFLIFKYAYLKNNSSVDTYVFYDIFKIKKSNILKLVLLALPIALEPIILLNYQKELSNKINIKLTTIFSILLSVVAIITILRLTWEFGALLDKIRFPYLESIKNIVAGKFFENIDYYYLLSLSTFIYVRIGFSLITIKKSFNLNSLKSFVPLSIIFLGTYILSKNMKFYEFANDKILLITGFSLFISTILIPFSKKRRTINNA